jgi:hypothetical protein
MDAEVAVILERRLQLGALTDNELPKYRIDTNMSKMSGAVEQEDIPITPPFLTL